MFPEKAEYFLLLLLASCTGVAIFGIPLSSLRRRSLWLGLALYIPLCVSFDRTGLILGWFVFNTAKTCGITILSVPIEEYLLFFLFYLFSLSAREQLNELL